MNKITKYFNYFCDNCPEDLKMAIVCVVMTTFFLGSLGWFASGLQQAAIESGVYDVSKPSELP